MGQVLSRESQISLRGRRRRVFRKATWDRSFLRERPHPRVVRDPEHVRKLLTREPGDPVFDLERWLPGRRCES